MKPCWALLDINLIQNFGPVICRDWQSAHTMWAIWTYLWVIVTCVMLLSSEPIAWIGPAFQRVRIGTELLTMQYTYMAELATVLQLGTAEEGSPWQNSSASSTSRSDKVLVEFMVGCRLGLWLAGLGFQGISPLSSFKGPQRGYCLKKIYFCNLTICIID